MHADEHTIELDNAPVFYRSAQAPGTPVLYLHGIPTSSDVWIAFLERTGGIAPDLIGFGRSGKAEFLDYSLNGHADFLERLLATLGVDRVKLVVHGWGAVGGLVLAQRRPERIERLVVCNALPLLDGFRWHRLGRRLRTPVVGEGLLAATTRWVLARELRRGCVMPDAWPDAQVATVWEQFDQGTLRAIIRLHRAADERRLAAAGAGLATLTMPALVLWGDRDPWLGSELADAYGAKLPRATVEHLADAGHWPWLDDPAVIDRIAGFLDERE